jgi:hypothetical protein
LALSSLISIISKSEYLDFRFSFIFCWGVLQENNKTDNKLVKM